MSLNSEEAVLGACLVDEQAFWSVADLVTPQDFGNRAFGRLFAAMLDRARRNDAFDAVTIMDDVPELGELAMNLASSDGWRKSNVRAYAQRVVDGAVSRRVKQAGAQIANLDGDDVLGQAQQLLGSCLPRHAGEVKHVRDFIRCSITELQRRVDSSEPMTGIATSLTELDRMTSGYQPGDLIVVAARPSVGKTAFTIQTLVNAARHGKHCLFFSLEMTGQKVADRILAHVAQVNAAGMKNPKLFDNADFGALFTAANEVSELPLHVDETAALTIEALCARARQIHAVSRLDLIAIDYLTQMTPPKAANPNEAWQIVTRALKALAKELSLPLILLSQLNRDGEGQRPSLRNLRDSGAIEQDADVVIFLHRENDHVVLIIGKQRDGEIGEIPLDANMRHQRFTESTFRDMPKPSRGLSGYPRRASAPSYHQD